MGGTQKTVRQYAWGLLFDQGGWIGAVIGAVATVASAAIGASAARRSGGGGMGKYDVFYQMMADQADRKQELAAWDKRIQENKSRTEYLRLQYAGGQVGSMPYPYVKIAAGENGTAAMLPVLIGVGLLIFTMRKKR